MRRRHVQLGFGCILSFVLWTTPVAAATAEKTTPEPGTARDSDVSPPPTDTSPDASPPKKPAPARRPRGTDGFVPSRKLPADSPVSLPTDI
jgi:hypothetical protein